MNSSKNNFLYRPVDSSKGEIRIIKFDPSARPDGQIHCSIFHASLENKPEYVTLSYMWGDASITKPIMLNGKSFQVTENLFAALHAIRRSFATPTLMKRLRSLIKPKNKKRHSSRNLWVDAICINQTNYEERSDQVRLMASIYESGVYSILWLGPATRRCDRAFRLLKKCTMGDIRTGALTEDSAPLFSSALDKHGSKSRSLILEELLHLWHLPVWGSIWIVQELVKANVIDIMYGDSTVDETGFMAALEFDPRYYSRWNADDGNHYFEKFQTWPAANIWRLRRKHHIFGSPSLLEVLGTIRGNFSCSDPRDQVYAIMGMANDTPPIVPDYQSPIDHVYCDFTFSHMLHSETLNLLEFASIDDDDKVISGVRLPSWAHNFETISSDGPIPRWLMREAIFKAGISDDIMTDRWEFRRKGTQILSLASVKVDRVAKITSFSTRYLDRATPITEYQRQFSVAVEAVTNLQTPYLVGTFDACWRTLLSDFIRETGNRLQESQLNVFREAFRSILQVSTSEETKGFTYPGFDFKRKDIAEQRTAILNQFGWDIRPYCFGYTELGYMGMFPQGTKEGDEVRVFLRAETPHVITKVSDQYEIVGPTYVHGIMDGEVVEWLREGKVAEERIDVV